MAESTASTPAAAVDHLQTYRNALARGTLSMQACLQCRAFRFPPSGICAECGSDRYEWRALSGRGTIWSFCVFHKDYFPKVLREKPYAVVLVQLEEGPRVYSNIVGAKIEALRVGLPVLAVFDERPDGEVLLKFRLSAPPA